MPLVLACESPDSDDIRSLIAALGAELTSAYGDDASSYFQPADLEVPRAAFVVVREAGVAVGCGALRELSEEDAEIKRLYVAPAFRRRGISRRILTALEELAINFGYARVFIETGKFQTAALNLYRGAGFQEVPAYGPYLENPNSICFEKELC